ncbi:hypothetical protein D8I24_0622 [Cupriavidus necator H850]|nr:hypothetical protein D8I24_0622 [Cupriavidus necator H850]
MGWCVRRWGTTNPGSDCIAAMTGTIAGGRSVDSSAVGGKSD